MLWVAPGSTQDDEIAATGSGYTSSVQALCNRYNKCALPCRSTTHSGDWTFISIARSTYSPKNP